MSDASRLEWVPGVVAGEELVLGGVVALVGRGPAPGVATHEDLILADGTVRLGHMEELAGADLAVDLEFGVLERQVGVGRGAGNDHDFAGTDFARLLAKSEAEAAVEDADELLAEVVMEADDLTALGGNTPDED